MKKLYALHICTMLCIVLYQTCFVKKYSSVLKLLVDILLHCFMLQPWMPLENYHATLNGPSWYLGACFFHYLCFPLILRLLKKLKRRRTALLFLSVFFLGQILVSVVAYFCGRVDYRDPFSMKWITYFFPVARLLDFIIGCLMGWLFLYSPKKMNFAIQSVLELGISLAIGCVLILYNMPTSLVSREFIKYTLIFTILNMGIVWLLATENSIFGYLLSRKIFVWIGNLSPFAFLIHEIIIVYFQYAWIYFLGIPKTHVVIVFSLIGTIIATLIWNWLQKKFEHLMELKKEK